MSIGSESSPTRTQNLEPEEETSDSSKVAAKILSLDHNRDPSAHDLGAALLEQTENRVFSMG
jgi:hypothetical protein